ncbi:Leucoanthocyanidin dioxygenase, putative [Ricinus communis]|uniref:Leucoanthocyanidin dioxygenase, putative n=1 Tax=Ricinus communis TaxID=3988 RepID=B9S2P9_RICCO|nr:Leucoanthocyanidin dioxygenase, putative [Ricinus communis]|eukprot:XP_025013308.1 flavanone 3-dioxygenase 3 [Ricinus communis]
MAETTLFVSQTPLELNKITSTINRLNSLNSGTNDEIPTIDYSKLCSNDPDARSKALEKLSSACKEFGCFNLVNHGIPERWIEDTLKGIYGFYDLTEEERKEYQTKTPDDRIRRCLFTTNRENRECLRVVTYPNFHCPPKPADFSNAFESYVKGFWEVKFGLARAFSKIVGLEENHFEKALKLELGFDVAVLGVYPPWFELKGSYGVPAHSDTGFFVSLIETAGISLDVLTSSGNWVKAKIPSNAMFILLGDHFEILTHGDYKSPIHKLVQDNEIKRISMAKIHGPSLDTFMTPAPEFVDQSRPPAYRGMAYIESLEANDYHQIDVHSNMAKTQNGAI